MVEVALKLLTLEQAADRLACSVRHLRRILADGEIPVVAIGEGRRGDRIDPRDLDSYIKRRKVNLKHEGGQQWGSDSEKIRVLGRYRSGRAKTALDDLLAPKSRRTSSTKR